MKYPYNRRVETTVQNWGQDSDDKQADENGSIILKTKQTHTKRNF